jgi:hypothetical protein
MEDLLRWAFPPRVTSATPTPILPVGTPASRVITPPGWTVAMPDAWRFIVLRPREALPRTWDAHLARKRLLHVRLPGRHLLWPVVGDPGREEPVPGVDVVLAATDGMAEADLVELLLVELDQVHFGGVRVPAHCAHRFGFIDQEERDRLVHEAQLVTVARMQEAFDSYADDADDAYKEKLAAALDCPAEFIHLLGRTIEVETPSWNWNVASIAAAAVEGTAPDALRWLTGYARRRRTGELEASMQRAWEQAYHAARESLPTLRRI